MKNLVIDIGNTSLKLAVFEDNEIIYLQRLYQYQETDILEVATKFCVNHILISSVIDHSSIQITTLEKNFLFTWFSHEIKIPISNQYLTPEKLGLDRLAAVIGAHQLYKDECILVIDAGSCITYDYIDSASNYYGGSISPGIEMRLKSMQNYTSKLPLIEFNKNFGSIYGGDTEKSILSGVVNGVVGEAKEFIELYNTIANNLHIILCGGNASFFDTRLKNSIFAHQISIEPNLVLLGLNTVLNYQND